jgi:hypothetical protein
VPCLVHPQHTVHTLDRVLPTSPREFRFSIAYSHPS